MAAPLPPLARVINRHLNFLITDDEDFFFFFNTSAYLYFSPAFLYLRFFFLSPRAFGHVSNYEALNGSVAFDF